MKGKLLDLGSTLIRVTRQQNNGYTYLRIFQGSTVDDGVYFPPQDSMISLSKEQREEFIKLLQEE